MKMLFNLSFIIMILFVSACDTGDDISLNPNNNTLGTGIVKILENNFGGSLLASDGSEIIVPAGSIGIDSYGKAGSISFSIENDLSMNDLPIVIPSKYKLIGNVIKFSPSSFVFTSPLMIYLPAASLSDLEGVSIIRLDEKTNAWVKIPITGIDADKKRLAASTFVLGYFAVVQETISSSKIPTILSSGKSGGLLMEHPGNMDYYYTILVTQFTPKYPEDANSGVVGSSGSTGGRLGADGPAYFTRLGGIPQGTYVLEISRIKRGTFSTLPSAIQYYSSHITVQVGAFSNTLSWDWANWTGWTNIVLSGGDWATGTPPSWPTPDVPFGTGEFQATLTWVNTDGASSDIDMHLFGPNDTHIYWNHQNNADGSIELDRDWRRELGYATENIYSTKSDITRGNYQVYVNFFSGYAPKNFEVRIIQRGNSVKTFRGTVNTINTDDKNTSAMQLIYSFSI